VHEGEAFATTEDVIVDDPLETDMHPIAEHPTDEAEAAAETPAEVRYYSLSSSSCCWHMCICPLLTGFSEVLIIGAAWCGVMPDSKS
jgi:hypothetical protein